MPSFLARLRAISHPNASSSRASANIPVTPNTPAQSLEASPSSQTSGQLLSREIHPDINSLLDLPGPDDEVVQQTQPQPPSAQKRRHPFDPLSPRRTRSRLADARRQRRAASPASETEPAEQRALDKGKARQDPQTAAEPPSDKPLLSRILSAPSLGSTERWSTFGRRDRGKTELGGDLGDRPGSRRSRAEPSDPGSSRRFGIGRREKGASTSRTNSVRSRNTFNRIASRPNTGTTAPHSPGGSMSKPPSSIQSSTKWSDNRAESSQHASTENTGSSEAQVHSTPSVPPLPQLTPPPTLSSRFARTSTPAARTLGFDSPNTFGHPTPAHKSASAPNLKPPASPPPPLPPLPLSDIDVDSLPSGQPRLVDQTSLPMHNQEETYPPRSFHVGLSAGGGTFANSVSFPSLPFTFGRPSRSQSHHPRVFSIFSSATELGQSSNAASRDRAFSDNVRRDSAEWSARQASDGVVAGASQQYGWPAAVSQEIVRLSLAERSQREGTQLQGTLPSADTAQEWDSASHGTAFPRGQHVQASSRPDQIELQGQSSSLFPPSHLLSEASQAAALASPILLASGLSQEGTGQPRSVRREASDGSQARSGPRRSRSLSDTYITPLITPRADQERRRMQRTRSKSNSTSRKRSREVLGDRGPSGSNGQRSAGDKPRKKTPSPPAVAAAARERTESSAQLLPPSVAVTAPTPQGSLARSRTSSEPDSGSLGLHASSESPPNSPKSHGKRKADEAEDGSPPGKKSGQKTTFAVQEGRGPPRVSNSSHAPSSYHSFYSRKRARIASPMTSPEQSQPGSTSNLAVRSSPPRNASRPRTAERGSSRTPSQRADTSLASTAGGRRAHRAPHSVSQSSIPISAILAPRVPSADRLGGFHMRDPRRPPRRQPTGWQLRFAARDAPGSPPQAWAFWAGFLFPPAWWLAAASRLPRTRVVGGADSEKAVTVDDPQIEQDARTWRRRCRIVSVLFFLTYAPIIILLAIFAPRR